MIQPVRRRSNVVSTESLLQWVRTKSSGDSFIKLSVDFILKVYVGTKARFCVRTSFQIYKTMRTLEPAQKSAVHSLPPHLQSLPARDLNSQPLGYESDSLTIRPWLPQDIKVQDIKEIWDMDYKCHLCQTFFFFC